MAVQPQALFRQLLNHVDMEQIVLAPVVDSGISVDHSVIFFFFSFHENDEIKLILLYYPCLTETSSPSSSSSVSSPCIRLSTQSSHLYCTHSWIPQNLEITLDEKRNLSVTKLDNVTQISNNSNQEFHMKNNRVNNDLEDKYKMSEDTDKIQLAAGEINIEERNDFFKVQKVRYELSSVICHIDDKSNEDRRNLVALIRVGENYHERSNGNSASQWYIFNDFR